MAGETYSSIPLSTNSREIRLISLSPSRDRSSKISRSLYKASLDDKPAYRALSYVWGIDAPKQVIELNGREFRLIWGNYHFSCEIFEFLECFLAIWGTARTDMPNFDR